MTDILRRNNVRVYGQGRPIIFAHGFGCDQNMWRFVVPAFQEEYQVILFDLVGSGKSDVSCYNPEKYSELEGYAGDIVELIKRLDLKKVTYVGHSVSSMIGLLAAIKEPALFDKMIFVAPSCSYINDGDYVGGFEKHDIEELLELMDKNYMGWASFLAPKIMNSPDNPALSEELTQSFCSTDPTVMKQFARVTFLSDNRADLPQLTVPSLLLQCTDDAIAPFSVGKYLNENINGSVLKILSATGHCPHMSAPSETIAAIKAYLSTSS